MTPELRRLMDLRNAAAKELRKRGVDTFGRVYKPELYKNQPLITAALLAYYRQVDGKIYRLKRKEAQ